MERCRPTHFLNGSSKATASAENWDGCGIAAESANKNIGRAIAESDQADRDAGSSVPGALIPTSTKKALSNYVSLAANSFAHRAARSISPSLSGPSPPVT